MKAILDLCGFKKQDTLPDIAFKTGRVEVAFYGPTPDSIPKNNEVMEKEVKKIAFTHYGKYEKDLPVFEYSR